MGLFRFVPARRRNTSPDSLIRIFQSETGEVREDCEPAQLRVTLHVLVALLVAMLGVTVFMQMNRVVTIWPVADVTTLFICMKMVTASMATSNPTSTCKVTRSWAGSQSSRTSPVSD